MNCVPVFSELKFIVLRKGRGWFDEAPREDNKVIVKGRDNNSVSVSVSKFDSKQMNYAKRDKRELKYIDAN